MKSLAVIALLLGGTSSVAAQYAPRVEAGDRVRLRTPSTRACLGCGSWTRDLPRELRGTVEELRADTIVIRTVGDTLVRWVWAGDAPTKLLVHGGRKSSWARGLGYGTLLGVAVGASLGFASGDASGGFFAPTAEEKAQLGGLGLGIIGGLIGVVAGGLSHHDVWVPAGVQPKVRPVISLDGRAGLAVSFSF